MRHQIIVLITLFVCFFALPANAQNFTQTVRGTVLDKNLQTPLQGANISIDSFGMGNTSDKDGNFKIQNVPVGRINIRVTFVGYNEVVLSNILLSSGKELVLTVNMEETVTKLTKAGVAGKARGKLANDMISSISARSFSVEETQKFAAAVNDPSRMATSFAGVVGADDGQNMIVIRGNAPNGLLWRMEGVDIPNPNHFANVGTSGGGISILSAQLMANSDFMTGAFSPEYGNALSGVFDMRLRKGNNQKREYTFQAGVLGIDAATEGPFSKKYKGSYLVNYRYSTLGLLSQLGLIPQALGGTTTFQDLSFNVYLPTNKFGNFSLFGFGGLSDQTFKPKSDTTKWESEYDRYKTKYYTYTGATGLTHSIKLSPKATLRTVLSASNVENGDIGDRTESDMSLKRYWDNSYTNGRIILSSTVTQKVNAQSTLRYGIIGSSLFYNLKQKENNDQKILTEYINSKGNTQTMQAFMQWKYKFADRFTFNGGLHSLYLALNNTYSVEPRASLRWDINNRNALSAGVGVHSQLQPLGVYFAEYKNPDGSIVLPNKNLGLNKANHYILSYDRSLSRYTKLKVETYYQHLYNIPVSANESNSFSMLNVFGGYTADSAVNKGTGRNYGLELTIDRNFNRGYYLLSSLSLYDSKYKGSDGILRDTRWNGRHAFTFTGGKEIVKNRNGKNKIYGLNIKTTWAGGFRETPINESASVNKGEAVYDENRAYTVQLSDYFRTDIRISMKTNHKRFTGTLALDIQNVTNNKNIAGRYYDAFTQKIKTQYQMSLLPILSYKVEF